MHQTTYPMAVGGINKCTPSGKAGGIPWVSTIFGLSEKNSRLTRGVWRDQILGRERRRGNIHFFPFSCPRRRIGNQASPVDLVIVMYLKKNQSALMYYFVCFFMCSTVQHKNYYRVCVYVDLQTSRSSCVHPAGRRLLRVQWPVCLTSRLLRCFLGISLRTQAAFGRLAPAAVSLCCASLRPKLLFGSASLSRSLLRRIRRCCDCSMNSFDIHEPWVYPGRVALH